MSSLFSKFKSKSKRKATNTVTASLAVTAPSASSTLTTASPAATIPTPSTDALSASALATSRTTATAPNATALPIHSSQSAPVESSNISSAAPILSSQPGPSHIIHSKSTGPFQNPFQFQSSISDEKWRVFSGALLVADQEKLKRLLSLLKDIVDSVTIPDTEVVDLVQGLTKELVIATLNGTEFKEDALIRVERGVDLLKDAVICSLDSRSLEQQATISELPTVVSSWKKDLGLEGYLAPRPEFKRNRWKIFDSIIEISIAISAPLDTIADLAPVPYLKVINGAVLYFLKLAEETRSNYQGVSSLARSARAFLLLIFDNYRPDFNSFHQAVMEFSNSLKEIHTTCQEMASRPFYDRVLKHSSEKNCLDDCQKKLTQAIDRFQTIAHFIEIDLLSEIKRQTVRIEAKIDTSLLSSLKELPDTSGDNYLPDSRTDVIECISSWVEQPVAFQFIWLHSGAGVGKSTLAHYLATCFKDAGCLAAYVSFKRGTTGEWSVKDIVGAMARQIAHYFPSTRATIVDGLQTLIPESEYASLLRSLIWLPLASLQHSTTKIIVFDGWDEYTYFSSIAKGLKALKDIPELPGNVHIIMTSRDEPAIREEIQHLSPKEMRIDLVDDSVMKRFFKERLASASPWLEAGDPDKRIPDLVIATTGLFVWAATACAIISNPTAAYTPSYRLTEILKQRTERFTPGSPLFVLYSNALRHLFPGHDPENVLYQRFPLLMALLIIIDSPMTADDLYKLIGHQYNMPEFTSLLRSLQTRASPHGADIVTPGSDLFHSSFIDYINNHCEDHFRITCQVLNQAHVFLAQRCIRVMSKYLTDKGRSNATDTPNHVRYAFRHWARHVACNDIQSWKQPLQEGVHDSLMEFLRIIGQDSSWFHTTLSMFGLVCGTSRCDRNPHTLNSFGEQVFFISTEQTLSSDVLRGAMYIQLVGCRLQGPDSGRSLEFLGLLLKQLWMVDGLAPHIESSLQLFEEALTLHPFGHPERSSSLTNLANTLLTHYVQSGSIANLDRAISLNEKALTLRSSGHSERSSSLTNLANALLTRYRQSKRTADLDQAISLYEEALTLRPSGHPERSSSLSNLANALRTHYEQSGKIADLDQGISLNKEALTLHPSGHPYRSVSLNNLASALQTRHKQSGDIADLDKAISLHEEALTLRPSGHPDRSVSLSNVAVALHARHKQGGEMADLNRAISLHEEALILRPSGHLYRTVSLNNLALVLYTRYQRCRVITDLNHAILLYEEALTLRPLGHPDRSASLGILANVLQTRYKQSGEIADLNRAISLQKEALALHSAGDSSRSAPLNDLANVLHTRYEQDNKIADLDQAISFYEEALTLCPPGDPFRSTPLGNLASALQTRYEQRRKIADLDQAISLNKEALTLHPAGHPSRATNLSNLANALHARYEQSKNIADLDQEISHHEEALTLRPPGNLDRSESLHNLAVALHTQYKQGGKKAYLNRAISLHEEALILHPSGHIYRAMSLTQLAMAFKTRYEQSGEMADLDQAILLYEETLTLRPSGHPYRSACLNNLADALQTRYDQNKEAADLERAVSLREEALTLPNPGSHRDRQSASTVLRNIGQRHRTTKIILSILCFSILRLVIGHVLD